MCTGLCLAVDVGLIYAVVIANSTGIVGGLITIGIIMFVDSGVIILFLIK